MKRVRRLVLAGALAAVPALAQREPVDPPRNCTTPEHRQFDFWIGQWDVYKTGTQERVARIEIEKLYGGCVLRESWKPFSLRSGGSFSSYDPDDGAWHMYWTDAQNARVAFRGGMSDGAMKLTGEWRNYEGPGQHRMTRHVYYRGDGDTVRHRGEVSADGGISWAVEFDFTYRPQELLLVP
jgi:hypothetical protein